MREKAVLLLPNCQEAACLHQTYFLERVENLHCDSIYTFRQQ